jgi:hypothetical protein
MRAPDPPEPPSEKRAVTGPPVVVLVVDEGLARAIDIALETALEYAALDSESTVSRDSTSAYSRQMAIAAVYSRQIAALMQGKKPRVCGTTTGGELAHAGSPWRIKADSEREETRCITDAMLLEYRIVRDAVRVFGLSAQLAKGVTWKDKPKQGPGLVARFTVWNAIARYIANATLEQMVKRRTNEMAIGKFDKTFEARKKIVETAWEETKTWLENDERDSEPIEVLEHSDALGSPDDQIDVEKARKKGKLPDITELNYEDENGKKTSETIEDRIKNKFKAVARFGRVRRYV